VKKCKGVVSAEIKEFASGRLITRI